MQKELLMKGLEKFEQTDTQEEELEWIAFLETAGEYYDTQEDLMSCIFYWERVISMEPADKAYKQSFDSFRDTLVVKYLMAGQNCLEEHDYEMAIEIFTKIIQADPGNKQGYLKLAAVYAEIKNYDRAIEILEQGYEKIQDDSLKEQLEEYQEYKVIENVAQEQGQEVIYVTPSQPLWRILSDYKSNICIVLMGEDYDGFQLSGYNNVTIWGTKETRIISSSDSDTVFTIHNSRSITLRNIILGHDFPVGEKHDCTAGVIQNWDSDLTLVNCDIFGCGLYGISVLRSTITAINTNIRDCSEKIMSVSDSNATFEQCSFFGNGYREPSINGVSAEDSTLLFSECVFSNNKNPNCIGNSTGRERGVSYTFDNCIFYGNTWGGDNVDSISERLTDREKEE